jgi:hypothetical protein
MKKIRYTVFYTPRSKVVMGIELPDKTILMNDIGKGLRIALPKRKFAWLFLKQMFRRGKYLEFIFSNQEIEILKQGAKTKVKK